MLRVDGENRCNKWSVIVKWQQACRIIDWVFFSTKRTNSGVPTPKIPPSEPRNMWRDDDEEDLLRLDDCTWLRLGLWGVNLICVPKKRLGEPHLATDVNASDDDANRSKSATAILMVDVKIDVRNIMVQTKLRSKLIRRIRWRKGRLTSRCCRWSTYSTSVRLQQADSGKTEEILHRNTVLSTPSSEYGSD